MEKINIDLNILIYPLLAVVFSFIVLFLTYKYLKKIAVKNSHIRVFSQLIIAAEIFFCVFLVILVLPVRDTFKGQILSFLGILLSATLALSSTTLLGNILAGIMLRGMGSLKIGDFIKTGDHFGRISEKGLFHIEIQTEYRNLITISNIFLIAKPIKVIHSSGTIISSEVSLGYDVSSDRIKTLLIEAAKNSGLEDPFVYILKLADFSILYRVNGLLPEVKYLISAHSQLNDQILKVLHRNSIEIVSPNFMNTRTVNDIRFISKEPLKDEVQDTEINPEDTVFEKANMAELLHENVNHLTDIKNEIEKIEKEMNSTPDKFREKMFQDRLIILKKEEAELNRDIEIKKEALNSEDK
ncbi:MULTISPECIES: mechanosensitive ion channel family protein [Psychrilyobacter]|uniref:Mechanosensitive ion channel family protein n=1 Tax=Psychrilyobacter piezotolerans TaxID=2293438 RepID=A0ABX9KGI6_9FUSO|nr:MULTISPECIES: mechanosensitive ion channel domain-containing protein [Psychrilyobacter]MCS5420453.1 mechanosensitive ion channel family protein [Psychrilyobacter sp. S5]NDI78231.1 mechanosensitive ion channel [Psychrilyobacter piezotolerans]RDE61209.1 mechanosensitive ion channel family protein [Psychrilyobacter sp. S5]REI40877.1 mechanosensitive ion channel family protein [Psychrilyobacter piezotolerans]